jgi:predicted AAA+ superfamily ATPase
MYNRLISLDINPKQSFYLWGARQTGKSTLLREKYPNSYYIDLLQSDIYARYVIQPHLIREDLAHLHPGALVVIDAIQKVPQLLDEIHGLIERRKLVFALSGSSARKLRRGHANLLGGRALRRELFGLSAAELGSDFNLLKMLNQGYLPPHYASSPNDWKRLVLSYVGDYLKEDIAAESLVRGLSGFSSFLSAAAFSDTEMISFTAFSRDVGISANTVKEYFSILEDSLIGSFLPAFTLRAKRRTKAGPKFYFHNVGLVNYMAKRGQIELGSEQCGKAFENWVAHELRCYNEYTSQLETISYWRLSTGVEVDFIIGDMKIAIEAKSSHRINSDHLKGLKELAREHPKVGKRLLVCTSSERRSTEDGIQIIPASEFIEDLWSGKLF